MDPSLSPCERHFQAQLNLEAILGLNTDHSIKFNQIKNDVKLKLVHNFLDETIRNDPIELPVDDFQYIEWVNLKRQIQPEELRGLLVVCDFFTYCCVNCLHILPFLHELENEYTDQPVAVIGIHSPKFEHEAVRQNVANALVRHNIAHPVCNDRLMKLWSSLNIQCWPSVALLGPRGQLLVTLVGENAIQNNLRFYLQACKQYFSNELEIENKTRIESLLIRNPESEDLLYPTKVAVSPSNKLIAIANTLKHSIIIAEIQTGIIEYIIGSGRSSFEDGLLEKCSFNNPQGLCWFDDHTLYVCDTENHAIRKIDLVNKSVITVARGEDQGLISPWDIIYCASQTRLYIAMAGKHQIWILILSKDGDTVHGRKCEYLDCFCFAGNGNEQKRDNRIPSEASFAQPTGLAIAENMLLVADSESSSVRCIDLDCGRVTTIVGATSDPFNLFAFGDKDGVGTKAKLQHCMGVASSGNDWIYVADTYNNKVRFKLNLSRIVEFFCFLSADQKS